MNLPLIALMLLASLVGVSAQGIVLFNNRVLADENGPLVDARIYRTSSISNGQVVFEEPLGGAYRAALYGIVGNLPSEWFDSLRMLTNPITGQGAVGFRTSAPGYVNVGTEDARVVPGAGYNVSVTLQIRAWAGGFNSYEEALAAGGYELGYSDPIVIQTSTGPDDQFPPRLVGMQPFTLAIPEPALVTLTVIGAALLMWRPRRNSAR
jgi:hypothetical protein